MIAAELAKDLSGHCAGATWMARKGAVLGSSSDRRIVEKADPTARGPRPVHRYLPITRDASADFNALTVGTVAKWTVHANETQSPTVVPWKPSPFGEHRSQSIRGLRCRSRAKLMANREHDELVTASGRQPATAIVRT